MNTKKKIKQLLHTAPKPAVKDDLLQKLKNDVTTANIKKHNSALRRFFAPAGQPVSFQRVAIAAVVMLIVMLPLAYGTAKAIKYFKIGDVTMVVKNSDNINNEEDARKSLEEFGKLYREGKAREVKPGVWVVTLSNGEEFAFAGRNPELVGLPDTERK